MRLLGALVAAQAVSAAVLPRQYAPCSFVMFAVGTPSGMVVEDTAGTNRIGGSSAQGNYYMIDHALYDTTNRNCSIDSTSSQFQCSTQGATFTNFSVSDYGNLMHNASDTFLACPTTDGSYNLFSTSKEDTTDCTTITLRTGGYNCTANGRPDPSSTTTTSLPAQTATPTSTLPISTTTAITSSSCPTNISSPLGYQFPHLIIPVSSKSPDTSFGNSYKAYITPINTTLFNFDIPSTPPYLNTTCSLIFLFPYKSDLDPSAGGYLFTGIEQEVLGNGGLDFALLSGVVGNETTFNSMPGVEVDYGKTQIIPGNNYTIARFPCQAGRTTSYSVSSVGRVELDYFQDSAPMPIGLYVVPCS